MGLPKRPEVVVRTPSAVFVGETSILEVTIDAEKQINVDFIDVKITGSQSWASGSNEHGGSYASTFPSLRKRVMDAGALDAGPRTFSVSFLLPPGTAPSHNIRPASARLLVDVHVSIPWWPDGRYRFEVPVRLPPAPEAQRSPVLVRVPYEVAGDEPRIEVALASSTLVAGETMLGSCAVFHLDDGKPREVDISFEPHLHLVAGRRRFSRWGDGYRTTVTLPAGTAGTAVPFRVGLPASMTPTFVAVNHEVQWYVKLKIGSLFAKRIEAAIPITILDWRASRTLPSLTLVPRLADERALAIFDRFASQQGTTMELVADELESYPGEQPAVVQAVDQSELRVGYAYRGTDGTYLIARASYPPLGIGLLVRPSSLLRSLLTDDIEVGLAEWDRVHRVDARNAAQSVSFLRRLVPTPKLGDLVRWTDDEIVFERKVVSVDVGDLDQLMTGLGKLVIDLESARPLIEAPPGLTVDRDAWESFAERLGGRLCIGDLSIVGTLDTMPVELGLEFGDGHQPVELRVHVGDSQRASERARGTTLSIAAPARAAELAQGSERMKALIAAWPSEIVNLELAQGVASASLPVAAGGADAVRVRELIRHLQALLASLDETTGPYR